MNEATKQTAPATGLFGGELAGAKVTSKLPYLNPGTYTVKVDAAVWKTVRAGGYKAFILEFTIVSSNRPATIPREANETAVEYDARVKRAPNAAGTRASWFQSCKDKDIGFGAIKGFIADITESNPEDPEFVAGVEQEFDEIINGSKNEKGERVNNGAINGMLVPIEVYTIMTKPKPNFPDGTPFSKHAFGAVRNPEGT